jgi:AraC-like DNA-binding protein
MMKNSDIYASELSFATHKFKNYHFCRGNSNKRKSRIGIVKKGRGTYIYLNNRLSVKEGDTVFIPEDIYCYSEWKGEPDIEVVYVSAFIHYDKDTYAPQILLSDDELKENITKICDLLSLGSIEKLEAYSIFYKVLQKILPQMTPSAVELDKTLQTALEYITKNWDKSISVSDIAKTCLVSESKLYHLFKSRLGQTPVHFMNSVRINVAINYLENSNYSISEISKTVGFNSENHFRKTFFTLTGTTPLKYRKKS